MSTNKEGKKNCRYSSGEEKKEREIEGEEESGRQSSRGRERERAFKQEGEHIAASYTAAINVIINGVSYEHNEIASIEKRNEERRQVLDQMREPTSDWHKTYNIKYIYISKRVLNVLMILKQ